MSRTEVIIHTVKIVLVGQRGRPHNPRIGLSDGRISTVLVPEDRGLFLSLADEQSALLVGKLGQLLLGDVVFPLTLGEADESNLVGRGLRLDLCEKRFMA